MTKAPYDFWKYYWKEPVNNSRAYMPGLGMVFDAAASIGDEEGTTPDVNIIYTDKASAGTDCLGFTQRAAGYRTSTYKWAKAPTDLAEGRINPDATSRVLSYPNLGAECEVIVDKTSYDDRGISLEELKKLVVRVNPGDVFIYGPGHAHIGIIQSIDTTGVQGSADRGSIFENIRLIESIYGDPICYVTKIRSFNNLLGKKDWQIVRLTNE